MGTMNKRKPHVFTTEIMENTDFWGKIQIFGFRNTDFDQWRLAALSEPFGKNVCIKLSIQ